MLVFELGTEELPAAYLPELARQLQEGAAQRLSAAHLSPRSVQAFATPRRLSLLVAGLPAMCEEPGAEIRGPSHHAAYDGQGRPTPALLGFLRSQRGTLTQVKIAETDRGRYVYFVKPPSRTPTLTVLSKLLPELIASLRAPKTMRWDASGARFARPIRSVLALYGSTLVPCRIGAVSTTRKTSVGRPAARRTVPIRSAERYRPALARSGVVLDHAARRERIERLVAQAAKRLGGRAAPETATHGLLDEVMYLAEEPVALTGTFQRSYLSLPREVLLASMAKHQRVFALERNGRLLPAFVGILDGAPAQPAAVRRMYEHILNARLADSLLFWTQDHARLPLERMAANLAGVTFHERLGSMADKSTRLVALGTALADAWSLSAAERDQLAQACRLAKADLVSTMVREFPTLQGIVGKCYAEDSGAPPAVAAALAEQYLPSGSQRPVTRLGQALSLLDKYDTLAGYFGLGIEPTGDEDPFGLRRAAQGIVEVAWAASRPLPLQHLFAARAAAAPFQGQPEAKRDAARARIHRYLLERLYTFAWPTPSPTAEWIDAVLASGAEDLVDAMKRVVALRALAGQPALAKAAKVVERTHNILKSAKATPAAVDPEKLQEAPERRLWEVYTAQRDRVASLTRAGSYREATAAFGEAFAEPIHEFFARVMVNVPDVVLQQNRLALMSAINTLYTARIADLSKLTDMQPKESA